MEVVVATMTMACTATAGCFERRSGWRMTRVVDWSTYCRDLAMKICN